MTAPTLIDLMRHGEPVGGRMFRGQTDDPLSDTGWQQMRDATRDPPAWQAIVSSPLLRCAEFATELAERLDVPLELDNAIVEVCFGSWEGKTPEQIEREDPGALTRFYHDPEVARPPDAEPLSSLQQRAVDAIDRYLDVYRGQHLLLVTHGGIIRSAIAHALGMPSGAIYRSIVDYAGITRLEGRPDRPLSVVFQNRRRAA